MAACNEAASHLTALTDEILCVRELARTVLEARSLLSGHDQHVASVLQLPSVCRLTTQHDTSHAELTQLHADAAQFGQHAVLFRSVYDRFCRRSSNCMLSPVRPSVCLSVCL